MSDNPKINVSLKLDGAKPWVTVYGDSAEELAYHLDQVAAQGIGPKAAAALASLMAGFEVGGQLGGQQVASAPVAAPQAAPAPAPQAPSADPWGQPQQAAPPAWAQPQQQAPAPGYAPAPAAPAPAPAAAPGAVQGPFLSGLGQYAVAKSGNSNGRAWNAWLDPRPKNQIDMIPKGPDGKTPTTKDPNDPRLAAGQAKFALFY